MDKDIQQANEFYAEQLGIPHYKYGDKIIHGDKDFIDAVRACSTLDRADIIRSNGGSNTEWTIQDARVRELIWEWLFNSDKITYCGAGKEIDNFIVKASHESWLVNCLNYWVTGMAKTYAAADTDCLIQIANKLRGEI